MFRISKEAKEKLERMAYLDTLDWDEAEDEKCKEYRDLMEEFKEEYEEFIKLLFNTGMFNVEIEKKDFKEPNRDNWLRLHFRIKKFYDNGSLVFLPDHVCMMVPYQQKCPKCEEWVWYSKKEQRAKVAECPECNCQFPIKGQK